MRTLAASLVTLVIILGASPIQMAAAQESQQPMMSMEGMKGADVPRIPPVFGYSEGQEIRFLHTEVSDRKIAKILTDMMGSPVLVVPSLAQAPDSMRAKVYVFTNGLKPDGPQGPLGYQPDVFDSPPGSDEYSPLREIYMVSWRTPETAGLLTSAADVQSAASEGEIEIERSGVVVNMPFVTWPGGER